jgi:hypothetical protein
VPVGAWLIVVRPPRERPMASSKQVQALIAPGAIGGSAANALRQAIEKVQLIRRVIDLERGQRFLKLRTTGGY